MFSYCGIQCDLCPAYQGTVTGDYALLEKAASTFGDGAYTPEEWICLGCTPGENPILARPCADCPIRRCAIARGVYNCAACADYDGCPHLRAFFADQPEEARKMARLRARFLAQGQEKGA